LERIIQQLRRLTLLPDAAALGDGELLERFRRRGDEVAFEALVRRHGAIVLGVCRRVLGNHHDAEDAFQATFLVLVRKAASVRPASALGNWLYGVAYRTALKARSRSAKSRAHERQAAASLPAIETPAESCAELSAALDHELSRLADKYRIPFILCDLEGNSHRDAARQLGWAEGTLSVRLMRAKKLLAKRLSGRGFGPAPAVFAGLASAHAASASVPTDLAVSTVKAASLFATGQAATGVISAEVAMLTQGVLNAMFLTKLKTALVIILVVGMAGFGARPLADVLFASGQDAKRPIVQPERRAPAPDEPERAAPKTDMDRIQGSWQVTSLEGNGKTAPEDFIKTGKYVFKGNEGTIFEAGKIIGKFTFTLDSSKTPKAIDIAGTDRGGKEKSVYGVYRFEADTFSLCIDEKRPNAFSGAGSAGLIQFKRIADDKKTTKEGKQVKIEPRDGTEKMVSPAVNAIIRKLDNERIKALREAVDSRIREYTIGKTTLPDYFVAASRLLLAAELDACETAAERVACAKQAVARVQLMKQQDEQRFNAGTIGPANYHFTLAHYFEVMGTLEREKAKTAPAAK
jgi:RNA polymerase sigma factor (sigma-70 family)